MAEYRVEIPEDDELAAALLAALARRGTVQPLTRGRGTALVLGGARSGKSSWAESQFVDRESVLYVATSLVPEDDPEWAGRVETHRSRRPAGWRTVETLDVAGTLREDDDTPLLVDCLALWLARVLDDVDAWNSPEEQWRPALASHVDELVAAVQDTVRDVVLVSNEVGSGVVPGTPSGRLYRDELGRLNARIAAACDELWLCVGGVARRWR
ncbi:MAG: bifunctional adenosylcobinamide kinase/adenosylcobinamide-phosphate guanylyltransferase [Propionibacteriaceae bacterium]|nr:bifunctional adenosylcobinamide kinase/adenosylcobinamide-phosphate guanylyltransferase [Propionibacteriaceae bacterium]